jgi:hypothetical protein
MIDNRQSFCYILCHKTIASAMGKLNNNDTKKVRNEGKGVTKIAMQSESGRVGA